MMTTGLKTIIYKELGKGTLRFDVDED